jgi:hypothetical protein
MLITIVAVANKDNTGLDLDRLEKVEDLDPEIAQKMLDGGTGRVPSEAELADYREALKAKQNADVKTAERADVEADTPAEAGSKFDNGGEPPAGETTVTNKTGEPEPATAPPVATEETQ